MQLTQSSPSTIASATHKDFCRTFKRDMKDLYLLSLLLTGEEQSAERCFFASLEDCMSLQPVLQHWAKSWTRRIIVQNAIRMLRPAAHAAPVASQPQVSALRSRLDPALRVVLQLSLFERFVFVISVLEGYSDRECSVLLRSSREDVTASKAKALQRLVTASQRKPTAMFA